MAGFLYYIPRLASIGASTSLPAICGLTHLAGASLSHRQVSGGPDGGDGVVFAAEPEHVDGVLPRVGYWKAKQRWIPVQVLERQPRPELRSTDAEAKASTPVTGGAVGLAEGGAGRLAGEADPQAGPGTDPRALASGAVGQAASAGGDPKVGDLSSAGGDLKAGDPKEQITHWIGWEIDSPPTPLDLARRTQISGWPLSLRGSQWVIPCCYLPRTTLPLTFAMTARGPVRQVESRFDAVCRQVDDWHRRSMDESHAPPQLNESFLLAVELLAINYRLGPWESAKEALNLLDSQTVVDVVFAGVGLQMLKAEVEAKKKAGTPSAG